VPQLQPHEMVQPTAQAQPHSISDSAGVGRCTGEFSGLSSLVADRSTSGSRSAFFPTEAGRTDENRLVPAISIPSHVPVPGSSGQDGRG
jgi:hypothetical protein